MTDQRFEGIGRLGKDGILAYTQSGRAQLDITVAIDSTDGPALWIKVVLGGPLAEAIAPHAKRGALLSFTGVIVARERTFGRDPKTNHTCQRWEIHALEAEFVERDSKIPARADLPHAAIEEPRANSLEDVGYERR
ncbi:MAG: single-stranded DNA-binding protein [Salinibacterium sp.]|nr:MAG: single-stranded DNA-binding protein [Salinibacterium sp.]